MSNAQCWMFNTRYSNVFAIPTLDCLRPAYLLSRDRTSSSFESDLGSLKSRMSILLLYNFNFLKLKISCYNIIWYSTIYTAKGSFVYKLYISHSYCQSGFLELRIHLYWYEVLYWHLWVGLMCTSWTPIGIHASSSASSYTNQKKNFERAHQYVHLVTARVQTTNFESGSWNSRSIVDSWPPSETGPSDKPGEHAWKSTKHTHASITVAATRNNKTTDRLKVVIFNRLSRKLTAASATNTMHMLASSSIIAPKK